jgi:hypothetical protein
MNSVQHGKSSPDASSAAHALPEVAVHSPGLAPCRCGRYFSEDFNGRLFCRGREGTDVADITPAYRCASVHRDASRALLRTCHRTVLTVPGRICS